MCSKRNGAASVHCHRAMNWPIPVASSGLWALGELLRRHVLKIVRPYIFRDIYKLEIPPNCNIIPALETHIPRGFFALFCTSYKKLRNLLHATKNYISKHKFLSKKNLVLFSILPSCHVIFPHSPHNSVMLIVLAEFVLCINKQV
jgi:hypothetical protein